MIKVLKEKKTTFHFTRPNNALDKRTILCLYGPGFQRQVLKHVKFVSERSKEMKEQKKNRESPCSGIRLLFPKSTVWPRNAKSGLFQLIEVHLMF